MRVSHLFSRKQQKRGIHGWIEQSLGFSRLPFHPWGTGVSRRLRCSPYQAWGHSQCHFTWQPLSSDLDVVVASLTAYSSCLCGEGEMEVWMSLGAPLLVSCCLVWLQNNLNVLTEEFPHKICFWVVFIFILQKKIQTRIFKERENRIWVSQHRIIFYLF